MQSWRPSLVSARTFPRGCNRSAARRARRRVPGAEPLERREMLAGDVVISEFLAQNDSGLRDQDSEYSDWLELHNTSGAPVDLEGWFLTDDEDDLNKWQLPAVTLPGDAYLVVFASGKDRAVAGAQLHTNFKLSASGEFLALVQSDGITVEHEYSPEFVEQVGDVSYGIAQDVETLTLVASGDDANLLIPTSAPLAGDWTTPEFDDTSWIDVTTGIGFQNGSAPMSPPVAYWRFDGDTADASGNNHPATLNNGATYSTTVPGAINSGQSLSLDGTNDQAMALVDISETASTISFWFKTSVTGRGMFSAAIGNLGLSGHDRNLYFTGTNIFAELKGTTLPSEFISTSGKNYTDNSWHHLAYTFSQGTQGQRVYVDGLQVASGLNQASIIGQDRLYIGFSQRGNPDFFNGLIDDVAVWNEALTPSQVAAIYGGLSPLETQGFLSQIDTDISGAMKNVNSSAYLRHPFTVADANAYDSLTLRVRYDDGFVAFLNGTEIARRNAVPGAESWNSAATVEHDNGLAAQFENIDVSAHVNLLQDGANVLAIHGLNASAANADFLLDAELLDIEILGESEHYFATPSPGAVNTNDYFAQVEDTNFSHDHGFYDAPFSLSITTDTPGATIRYTTDGTPPSPTHGTIYSGPIAVSTTATVRAIAYKAGFVPTNVDTQTYLFLASVLQQPVLPNGYPTVWQPGYNADYQMDPDVVTNPAYSGTIINDLKSIPTISLVTDKAHFFDANTGIYTHTTAEGVQWERPVSMELIYPDGREGFQIDAGVRIHGGYSRYPEATPKHSFRLLFKEIYGSTKLNFPLFADTLFGESAVESFDTLVLRAGFNYSWVGVGSSSVAEYLRDTFTRDTQWAMGQVGSHGNFMHLYINGLYWGMYNPSEKPYATFQASYYGGEPEDYDVMQTLVITDGNVSAWNTAISIANGGLATQAQYDNLRRYVDVENLIDYLITNIYGSNWDWPGNNWFAARRSRINGVTVTPDINSPYKFRFFNWDAEGTLDGLGSDRTEVSDDNTPGRFYSALRANPEFRLLFADRLQKHFFNGGALSPTEAAERYALRMAEIDRAVVGESARWGDGSSPAPPAPQILYSRNVHWTGITNSLLTSYFPQRTGVVLGQFRADGLYPNTETPLFSQRGGRIAPLFQLSLNAPAGDIYFTTDGSDPRLQGGSLSPSAQLYTGPITLNETALIRTRARNGADWSAIDDATFGVDASALRVSEIMYAPEPPLSGAYVTGDYQYVEVQNTSASPLDLNRVQFTEGITFTFPDATLAPGARAVVAINAAAFATRYPGVPVLGTFTGRLSADGESLKLVDAVGFDIHSFEYDDNWYPVTDGQGFSLVIVDSAGPLGNWNLEEGWRASQGLSGNPGAGDFGVTPGAVVINEVLSHTDAPSGDRIELANRSAAPVDISGWFLSDSRDDLAKYRIADGTVIPAGQFIVFNQFDHFDNPLDPGATSPFGLSEFGEAVYLSSHDGSGGVGGYRESVDFGAAEGEVSFGRYIKSTGVDFVAQSIATFGAANVYPLVGPVVLNEIMYNPLPGEDEYIELLNISGAPASLFDPANPTNTWQFTNGIEFTFPTGVTLPVGGYALVVPVDPAAFRTRYNISAAVPIYGPYVGALDNAGERLELSKPGLPEIDFVPYIAVDGVRYDDDAPWSLLADNGDSSLSRLVPTNYANDVINWPPSFPDGTPGEPNSSYDVTPPTVPTNVTADFVTPTRVDVAWTASTDIDEANPDVDLYRVYRNGVQVGTSPTTTYSDLTVTSGTTYNYQISAVNDDGYESALSTPPARANNNPTAVNDTYSLNENTTLSINSAVDTQVTLATTGSIWKYLDNGTNQGTAWRAPGYNDAAWAQGASQLGYGDGDEATIVGFGGNAANKYITTYFRRTFTLSDVIEITALNMQVLRDDGVSVYLNGTEVVRNTLPGTLGDNAVLFNTLGLIAVTDEGAFLPFNINPALLVNGNNTLAVEIHQVSVGSSDISFDMILTATRHKAGITSNDVDADGDTLVPTVLAPTTHGDLSLSPNGFFTYTPFAGFNGVDNFTYKVNDGYDDSNVATVTFNVSGVNDAPTARPGGPYLTNVGVPVQFDGRTSSDPETASTSLTYQWDYNYNGVTFDVDATGSQPTFSSPTAFAPRTIGLRVTDPQGLSHIATTTLAVTVPTATISGRHIYYNNSAWDGNSPAASSTDDLAIATDKSALLPGGTGSLANYTSFSKGITGIMVDVMSPTGTISVADFAFMTGNSNNTATWTPLVTAPTVSLRVGAGVGGSTRVSLTWPDETIKKTWLQVAVLATAATGLASNDVFYFGNAVGEAGDTTANALVNATDEIQARANPRNIVNPAPITFLYDYNRDKLVNATDQIIARSNTTNVVTAMRLIVPTGSPGAAPLDAGLADAALAADGDPLDEELVRRRRR